MATNPTSSWQVRCTGKPVPLRDFARYAMLLDETCRLAVREVQAEDADADDTDEAALLVRLASSAVRRSNQAAGWTPTAPEPAEPCIVFGVAPGPGGTSGVPTLTWNGPTAILEEAARHLGAVVGQGHIEIDTSRMDDVLARLR